MIVSGRFEGDEDMSVAVRQHGVYADALNVIVATCNQFALFARAVLADKEHSAWGMVTDFDHRLLQDAHDLLAAAWRHQSDLLQATLPLGEHRPATAPEDLWLSWLRDEVLNWVNEPHLVRSVQLVLTNQNRPRGYAENAALCLAIMNRFGGVPWRAELRRAHETTYDKLI